jgi:hypothetical protein
MRPVGAIRCCEVLVSHFPRRENGEIHHRRAAPLEPWLPHVSKNF